VASLPLSLVLPLHWSEYQADVWFLLLSLATQYIGAARSRFTSPSASQRLTFRQALAAPLVASASLLFVYWLIVSELVDVEALLVYYFGLVGFACLATFACAPLRVLADSLGVGGPRWRIELPEWLIRTSSGDGGEDGGGGGGGRVRFTWTPSDFAALALAAAGVWVWAGPAAAPLWWPLSNLVTVALLAQALELLLVGSFGTCAALLVGLMLYDALFVFAPLLASSLPGLGGLADSAPAGGGGGTDSVMVAVATSDLFTLAPNKLVYPAAHLSGGGGGDGDGGLAYPFSILGGGDIAIPGLLTALLLRFDHHHHREQEEGEGEGGRLFATSLLLYALGYAACALVGERAGAAQPALVYLVPALLLGSVAAARLAGRLQALMAYKDPAPPK